MKIKFSHVIFLLIAISFHTIGCKKTIFDYRHKYIGEWDITIIRNFSYPYHETIDTSYYQGEIVYGDNDDDIEIIDVSYSGYFQFTVDKEGQLSCPNQDNPVGVINKKTLDFIIVLMSPGSHTTLNVNGQKK
jgi:hypothetical protein